MHDDQNEKLQKTCNVLAAHGIEEGEKLVAGLFFLSFFLLEKNHIAASRCPPRICLPNKIALTRTREHKNLSLNLCDD